MKFLKIILFILLIVIIIPLVLAWFLPTTYHIERSVIINRPKNEIFAYIKSLRNQDKYSKWALIDPDMDKTFTGIDGKVGFTASWVSNHKDVGVGEQEIIAIREGDRVDYELRFKAPFESIATAYLETKQVDRATTNVIWGFDGKMDYPMNLMLLTMDMDKMVGNDLQEGLDNLKNLLDRKPVHSPAPIEDPAEQPMEEE